MVILVLCNMTLVVVTTFYDWKRLSIEQMKITDKGHEITRGNFSKDGQTAPQPDHNGETHIGKDRHHGEKEGQCPGKVHIYRHILLPLIPDLFVFPRLPIMGLYYPDPRKGLPDPLGKIRKRSLDRFKAA